MVERTQVFITKANSSHPKSLLPEEHNSWIVLPFMLAFVLATYFGMALELDAHFRQKALITAIATTPVFAVLAWQRFSSREI